MVCFISMSSHSVYTAVCLCVSAFVLCMAALFLVRYRKRSCSSGKKNDLPDNARIVWRVESAGIRNLVMEELSIRLRRLRKEHLDKGHVKSGQADKKHIGGAVFPVEFEDCSGIVLECSDDNANDFRNVLVETITELGEAFDGIRSNLEEDVVQSDGNIEDFMQMGLSSKCDLCLSSIVPENCVLTELIADNYEDAVREIVMHMHRIGIVGNADKCLKDIMSREKLSSTKFENGTALPHARSSQVSKMVSSIALCREKVEGAESEQPLIIVLTLCPTDVECPYMSYIAHAASILMSSCELEFIREEDDPSELRKIFIESRSSFMSAN